MASKYIQTTLSLEVYKSLRIEAIRREVPFADFLREILEDWTLSHLKGVHHDRRTEKESEKVDQGLDRAPTGQDHGQRREQRRDGV